MNPNSQRASPSSSCLTPTTSIVVYNVNQSRSIQRLTLKIMLVQGQSPLFSLPRETRDEIYAYCMHEDEGYHHVFDISIVGQLRQANGQTFDISLKATCKKVAQEIKGVALLSNAIHFYPSDHQSNSTFRSNALRFKRLVEYVNITKWRMLLRCATHCVTAEILETIERQYPDRGFTVIYRQALLNAHRPRYAKGFNRWYADYEKYSRTGHRAADLFGIGFYSPTIP
ncbi:hypothetical protein CC86DRAFT_408409 [Ophiobolus disseminans]|uniref:Uncharacterized protein n=1 Tax=Ophiobolus disseminans TaxID=1469910 RepID=A0A6A6ZUP6_9PLEO|nr:hypothetical protein CC86DRAFT_408409 [Ophiobolus disseminans]